MKKTAYKLLEFDGKTIPYTVVDGEYWVAIKPICEALNVNYNRQYQNLTSDEILSQLFAEQQIVAADSRRRKMICLPEKFIYGWLFSIRSDSEELKEYKMKCYEVLFDFFKGTITRRQKALVGRVDAKSRIQVLSESLMDDERYVELREKEAEVKKYNKSLLAIDKEMVSDSQLSAFD